MSHLIEVLRLRRWSKEQEQPNTEEAWLCLVLWTLVKSVDQELRKGTTKWSRTFLMDRDSWSGLQMLVWAIYKWLPLVLLGTARSVKFVMAETRSGLDSMPLGKMRTPWTIRVVKRSPHTKSVYILPISPCLCYSDSVSSSVCFVIQRWVLMIRPLQVVVWFLVHCLHQVSEAEFLVVIVNTHNACPPLDLWKGHDEKPHYPLKWSIANSLHVCEFVK